MAENSHFVEVSVSFFKIIFSPTSWLKVYVNQDNAVSDLKLLIRHSFLFLFLLIILNANKSTVT